MKLNKGLLITLIIFGIFTMMSLIFFFSIKTLFDAKPIIQPDSALKVTLSGSITEWYSRDAFSREFEGATQQVHSIRKALAMAQVDDRIKGVYLRIVSPQMGWAKADAIKRNIEAFKKSGKWVVAYIDFCDEKSYYVGLAADEIYLPPNAFAMMNGFAANVPFLKQTFNKLGIEPQVDNIGKYKSAGDVLKRDNMSPAHREATTSILTEVYNHFVETVCASRPVEREEFELMLDKGIYNSNKLENTGLITGLKHQTEVLELLKKKVFGESNADDKKLSFTNVNTYSRLSPSDFGVEGQAQFALIYALGTIMSGNSGHSPINGRTMGAESVVEMLRAAGDNDKIKAIIMRVDSPGGSAQASDEIWAEVARIKQKKPVIISMSDVAASGGYWISMNSDAIVAEPLTITGSIGVVISIFDMSGAYEKLGINWETVKVGKFSDVPTDKRPLTPEEWRRIKEMSRETYKVFVDKVADGRETTSDDIEKVAQGRVWTGRQALQRGLVDSLGGLETAVAIAKEKAGLSEKTVIDWQVYPRTKSFAESLMEKLNVGVLPNKIAHQTASAFKNNLPADMRVAFEKIMTAALFKPGEILTLEEQVPDIR